MNLPSGSPLVINQELRKANLERIFSEISRSKMQGYMCVTIRGIEGVEESALVFLDGRLAAAGHEFLKFGVSVEGKNALPLIYNAFAAEFGILELFELSREQVLLVLAFNEKAKLERPLDPKEVPEKIPKEYNPSLAEQMIKRLVPKELERAKLLQKYGLGEIKIDFDLEELLKKMKG